MIQIPEEDWADIKRRLNPPPRPRVSEAELTARHESARRCGPVPGSLWRHKGTGGLYQIVAVGLVEATLEPVVVYRGHGTFSDDGPVYTRPLAEFRERFVAATGERQHDPWRDGVNPDADRLADPRTHGEGDQAG